MKENIRKIIILFFSCLIMIVSCDKVDVPEKDIDTKQSDETGFVESNSGTETDTGNSSAAPIYIDEDVPFLRKFSAEDDGEIEYNRYLSIIQDSSFIRKHKNFVSFEELLSISASKYGYSNYFFKSVSFFGGGPPWYEGMWYQYQFEADYPLAVFQEMTLTICHGELPGEDIEQKRKEQLPEQYFEKGNPILVEHMGADMRHIESEGTVAHVRDGIRYTYCDGMLYELFWTSKETRFWLTFDEPFFEWSKHNEEEYDLIHPVLEWFLNKDQTATAIENFDAMITRDEVNRSN